MNQAALFCDGTESYVIPPEPEMNSKVTIRFRTAKNDRVKVFLLSKGEGQEIEDSQEMEKECTERSLIITPSGANLVRNRSGISL